MPGRIDNSVYVSTGDPKTDVSTSAGLRPGELGKVYCDHAGYRWQRVVFDGTLTLAATAGYIVYWMDAASAKVTTDLTDSEGSRNTVAGVLHKDGTMPTASQYAWILQEGNSVSVYGITGVNFQAGGKIVASSTAGQVTVTAQATAAVDNVLGTVHTAHDNSGGAGLIVCDINIPSRLF